MGRPERNGWKTTSVGGSLSLRRENRSIRSHGVKKLAVNHLSETPTCARIGAFLHVPLFLYGRTYSTPSGALRSYRRIPTILRANY